MRYRAFISYARENHSPSLETFVKDLNRQISQLTADEGDEVAFFDRSSLPVGSDWSKDLFDAAATSRVLVCLVSPHYTKSDYCGREFEVFRRRIEQSSKTAGGATPRPLYIQPVIWIPMLFEGLPEVLRRIQLDEGAFPDDYGKKGLDSIAKRPSLREAYIDTVEQLARRIVDASEAEGLPPLEGVSDLEEIRSAFLQKERAAPVRQPGEAAAPLQRSNEVEVRCLYVAGSAAELSAARLRLANEELPLKTNTEIYGRGGWYWQPYHPSDSTQIGLIVQNAIGYRIRELELGQDMEAVLRAIQLEADNDNIILLVVDVWSAFLERYGQFLSRFDRDVRLNTAVLVPWNEGDRDTSARRDLLENKLRVLFRTRYQGDEPVRFYRPRVSGIEEFRTIVRSMLAVITADIETYRAAQLRINGKPLDAVRTARGESNV